MNCVPKELITGVIYGYDIFVVWTDLRECFDKVDASRSFYLHKEIATLTQGTSYVSVYHSRLKDLWDEYETLVPYLGCDCVK